MTNLELYCYDDHALNCRYELTKTIARYNLKMKKKIALIFISYLSTLSTLSLLDVQMELCNLNGLNLYFWYRMPAVDLLCLFLLMAFNAAIAVLPIMYIASESMKTELSIIDNWEVYKQIDTIQSIDQDGKIFLTDGTYVPSLICRNEDLKIGDSLIVLKKIDGQCICYVKK